MLSQTLRSQLRGSRRLLSTQAEDLVKVSHVQSPQGHKVAVVSMNRAPVNSLDSALVNALSQTIRDLEAQDDVRAMVLKSDQRVFSAGLDLKEVFKVSRPSFERFWNDFETLWRTLYLSKLATVAAIESHAPAGGSILALSCDYRIVATDKPLRMGLNETQLGMLPPRWLQAMCARTVGDRNAEFILQHGELMDAKRALDIKFVDEGVNCDQVMDRAIAVAEKFSAIPPLARQELKFQLRSSIAQLAGPTSSAELWNCLISTECTTTIEKMLDGLKKKK